MQNLDASIDTQALHATFSAFGFVLSCKVAVDVCGRSKGHGFVQFEDEESARIAIEKVNGVLMMNRKVSVLPFVPHTPQVGAETPQYSPLEFLNQFVSMNASEEFQIIFYFTKTVDSLQHAW